MCTHSFRINSVNSLIFLPRPQLKVNHRDVFAKQKHIQATKLFATYAALSKKDKKDPKNIKPDPIWKGFIEQEFDDGGLISVEDLQKKVATVLDNNPIAPGIALVPNNIHHIWVFKKVAGNKLQRLNKGDNLEDNACYFCLEVFPTVPTDLYRTVALNQLEPATFCLPEKAKFTSISPFYTAAMSKKEHAFPWYSLSNDGLAVNGISVFTGTNPNLPFCDDPKLPLTDDKRNPFKTVQKGKGVKYSIALGEYDGIAKIADGGRARDPYFGVLKTLLSHDEQGGLNDEKIAVDKSTRQKGDATEQTVYFRFALRKGTPLGQDHGMAVVYDATSEGHCSLVRLQEKQDESEVPSVVGQFPNNVYLKRSNKAFKSITPLGRRHMLSPEKKKNQPETLYPFRIAGQDYHVFPRLAPSFYLHDVEVKARAEPLPLETFDDSDGDAEVIFRASVLLFNSLNTSDDTVYTALGVLEAHGFIVADIDASFLNVLLGALWQVDKEKMTCVECDAIDAARDIITNTIIDKTK